MIYKGLLSKGVSDKLRFLFIAPGNLAGDFANVPNGIGVLAAILKMNNVFVKAIDYSVDELDYDALKQIISNDNINVVGITMMTCQAPVAYEIAKFVKETNPSIVTLAGGMHPTLLPEESLDNSFDIVFRDEAEKSFPEAMQVLADNGLDYNKLKNIAGISFKENNKIVNNVDAQRIAYLDDVPLPAYELFKFPQAYSTQFLYKKGYSTNLITSRGCTGHCVFCSKHYQGVNFESAEKIVEHFIFLKDKYNISQVFIQDDLFTHDLDRVSRFCDLLIKEKLNLPWVCSNTRADSINYELFKKMKQSGCISVAFGVESGNETVRRKIGKNLKTEDIFNAVNWAKKAGLLTSAFYIFGHHCESMDDAMDTIKFAIRLNTDTVCFSINCPFPGTPLYNLLRKKGIVLTDDWGKYRTWGEPLFDTEFLTKKQIVDLQKMAYMKYYLRPGYLTRQAANIMKTGNLIMYWRGLRWVLEQYFDYKVAAKKKPAHILINEK